MSELTPNPKCNTCKCYFVPILNERSGLFYKSCERCKIRAKEKREKNKCEHNRERRHCKDCGGASICEHNRIRSQCKDCGGASICEHNRHRSRCKECGGGSICEHNRIRSKCKDCGGASICEHNRERSKCKDCGGSQICEHNRERSKCKDCGGSSICEHNRRRSLCKDCSPMLYLVSLQRSNIHRIIKQSNLEKTKPTIEYLGCSAEYFKSYIQSKMTGEMNFDNIHFDHIKPISKFDLNDENELLECCHYTNFQPLLANDNLIKSNKWNDEHDLFWKENICGKEYISLYIPI